MSKILVVGSLNMDMVTKVVKTPQVGETVTGQGLELIPGGKGANQAVAMGKLGANVEMVGLVGADANGVHLKKNLDKVGVGHNHVNQHPDSPTGVALIMVNESADNSIVVIPGANGLLTPAHVDKSWFEGVSLVVCQLEVPIETVHEVFKVAKSLGVKTVLNPAPAKPLSEELLSTVDLLIPNETEFESLTGYRGENHDDLIKGYERLNQIGISELIVTLGSKGACYYNGQDIIEVPAKKVKAVDTTAAGDSFIAGVCKVLASGGSIEEALKLGTHVAAITVTRFGAQSSLPTKEEVEKLSLE